MMGSGISKHGWNERFLSSSAAGLVFRRTPKEDERSWKAYSINVYVTRDDSKSLPLRYFMFVIHTLIQWHRTWYSLWVMQIHVVECLKWKQRSSGNTMIPAPAMRVSIIKFLIKLRLGNKAIQVGIDLHKYSSRGRKNPLGLHCDSLDCSNSCSALLRDSYKGDISLRHHGHVLLFFLLSKGSPLKSTYSGSSWPF